MLGPSIRMKKNWELSPLGSRKGCAYCNIFFLFLNLNMFCVLKTVLMRRLFWAPKKMLKLTDKKKITILLWNFFPIFGPVDNHKKYGPRCEQTWFCYQSAYLYCLITGFIILNPILFPTKKQKWKQACTFVQTTISQSFYCSISWRCRSITCKMERL